MSELFQLIMSYPWQLRVAVGHFLPLAITLFCLWQIRGHVTKPGFVGWCAFVLFGAVLTAVTMKFGYQVVNGKPAATPSAIMMPFHWMLPLMAAFASYGAAAGGLKFDARVVWPAVFLPLYALDMYGAATRFPLDALYRGIGGAGPIDVLLISPACAVVMARVAHWETSKWPGTVAKAKRLVNRWKYGPWAPAA